MNCRVTVGLAAFYQQRTQIYAITQIVYLFCRPMERQHRVILSLGSNEGDRKTQIEAAIAQIHQSVGTVIRISRLYESPAWGFEGGDFYNAAVLIHSLFSPAKVLHKILAIERVLGRKRKPDKGYASRGIDIDLISFDELAISGKNLQLPHPRMEARLFVLLPLKDVLPDFRHSVSGKTILELIASTPDKSDCTAIGTLKNPIDNFIFGQFSYLAIEGNIGAGKTTLTNRIAEDFNAKTVLERFADNPFLPKFYKDQSRYAFPLEMSFLADRYQQLVDDISQFDLFRDFIVSDYHIFKSLIFARITLSDDEYRLYRKLFDIIYKEMPRPDLYVYLYQDTERLLANIKKRGRSYEQEIPAEYLDKINKGYLDYLKLQSGLNILVIDLSKKDFVNQQEDYLFVLEEIRKKAALLAQ